MHNSPSLDRRRNSSRRLSIIVDMSVVCLSAIGERCAELLLLANDVPIPVAYRVLFHEEERRPNSLCKLFEESGCSEGTTDVPACGWTALTAASGNGILVVALRGALQAMMLTHGCRVTVLDSSGILNFEREMLNLRQALSLLSIDPDAMPE